MIVRRDLLATISGIAALLTVVKARPLESSTQKMRINRGRYIPELHGAARGKYMPDYSGKYRHIAIPYNGGYGDRGDRDRGLKYINEFREILRRPPDGILLGSNDHLRFMVDFNYNGTGWQIVQFEWIRDGDESKNFYFKNENRLWDNSLETNDEGSKDSEKYYYNYNVDTSDKDETEYYTITQSTIDSTLLTAEEQSSVEEYVKDDEENFTEYTIAEGTTDNIQLNEEYSQQYSSENTNVTDEPNEENSEISFGKKDTDNDDNSENETSNTNVHLEGEYNDHTYNVSYQNNNLQQNNDTQQVRMAIGEVLDYIQKYILSAL